MIDDGRQKCAVVADQNDRARECLEVFLQPARRVEVEVLEDVDELVEVELELEVLDVIFPDVELVVETLPELVEVELPPVEVEVELPPVEVEVELPPVEVELPPVEVEVEPPLLEVELPVLELSLSISISTLVAPPLLLPPKNPPKKPPPKPPKPPLEPPITIGWPPPAAMIGCCGSCGSGTGTIAYCASSQHSRSTTRRAVRSRGMTRSARRSLT